MNTFSYCNVSVTLPSEPLPAKAGSLSRKEVRRLPLVLPGVVQACEDTARSIENAGPAFLLPEGVSPESLRLAGSRVQEIDELLAQIEYVVSTLKQARKIYGAEAMRQLGRVNDQAQAQGKERPQLFTFFRMLFAFFAKPRKKKPAPKTPATTTTTNAA